MLAAALQTAKMVSACLARTSFRQGKTANHSFRHASSVSPSCGQKEKSLHCAGIIHPGNCSSRKGRHNARPVPIPNKSTCLCTGGKFRIRRTHSDIKSTPASSSGRKHKPVAAVPMLCPYTILSVKGRPACRISSCACAFRSSSKEPLSSTAENVSASEQPRKSTRSFSSKTPRTVRLMPSHSRDCHTTSLEPNSCQASAVEVAHPDVSSLPG